jgi:hypothetical protein
MVVAQSDSTVSSRCALCVLSVSRLSTASVGRSSGFLAVHVPAHAVMLSCSHRKRRTSATTVPCHYGTTTVPPSIQAPARRSVRAVGLLLYHFAASAGMLTATKSFALAPAGKAERRSLAVRRAALTTVTMIPYPPVTLLSSVQQSLVHDPSFLYTRFFIAMLF